MPYKDKNRQKEYQRKWDQKRTASGYSKTYGRKLRQRAIDHLGGKCVYCDCDEFDALEINHIYGGGNKDRSSDCRRNKSFLLAILRGEYDGKIELTCSVCNRYHYIKILKGVKGDWKITWSPVVK